MTELHYAPAHELVARIKAKKIGARELLDHFLNRIETHNPALNAVIWSDPAAARARAEAADAALARGEDWGPLHGLPMTVKESYDLAGSPTTWGDPALKDNIRDTDSTVVERLKKAGAIVFGKTNVPLDLADWQSFNAVYGTTNNPWNHALTPGGSSGGSAAALAAGLTGLEAGSDIGASIRNPAHYCGVFGHKPTYGIVPPRGQARPGVLAAADISVVGPMARSAEDLSLALDVMAGPDAIAAAAWKLDLPAPRHKALRDFRVAVMLDDPVAEIDGPYRDRLQAVVDALARAGATVSDRARPGIDSGRAMELYVLMLRAATSGRMTDERIALMGDVAARLDPSDGSYLARMARASIMRHRDWLRLNNEREGMRLAWARFFEDWDILLCPAAASAAWPHDQSGERHDRTITVNGREQPTTDQLFWAGYSGVVYLPSTVSPAGLTDAGLPVGLQAVAAHGEDRTSIEFCRLLAAEIGGFVPPPGYA
ncbi:amidase [Oceanibacterium hippocampi]|uniref:Acylamidase n=1 Tax=Oceanibacterium hippocampi TaxID=745714 RepID=A0A1Y5TXR0_9PROT|nr:amidase [Oceanibacterium hippocampi]SLN75957.1 Acylamidase [Oceanibacterium hippocampi]